LVRGKTADQKGNTEGLEFPANNIWPIELQPHKKEAILLSNT